MNDDINAVGEVRYSEELSSWHCSQRHLYNSFEDGHRFLLPFLLAPHVILQLGSISWSSTSEWLTGATGFVGLGTESEKTPTDREFYGQHGIT